MFYFLVNYFEPFSNKKVSSILLNPSSKGKNFPPKADRCYIFDPAGATSSCGLVIKSASAKISPIGLKVINLDMEDIEISIFLKVLFVYYKLTGN